MHLCIASHDIPTDPTTNRDHCMVLKEALTKEGHVVSFIPFVNAQGYLSVTRYAQYAFELLRRARNCDVLYVLNTYPQGLAALFVSMLLRKRLLVRIEGDAAWEYAYKNRKTFDLPEVFSKKSCGFFWQRASNTHGRFSMKVCSIKLLERALARRAEKVIVPSRFLKNIISNWGIEQKKIHVVHAYIDQIVQSGNRKALRNLLQLQGKLILSAGELVPWNGFDTLITLIPHLKESFPEIKLMIVGDGPDMPRLTQLIRKLQLEEEVTLAGPLPVDTLHRYLESSDCFVLNAVYGGFSYELLAAMECSVPIVASDTAGNPELLDTETSALLVPYADVQALHVAIQRILESERFSNHIVFHAKKKVQHFSHATHVQALLKILI